jgi:hypothetical protein
MRKSFLVFIRYGAPKPYSKSFKTLAKALAARDAFLALHGSSRQKKAIGALAGLAPTSTCNRCSHPKLRLFPCPRFPRLTAMEYGSGGKAGAPKGPPDGSGEGGSLDGLLEEYGALAGRRAGPPGDMRPARAIGRPGTVG